MRLARACRCRSGPPGGRRRRAASRGSGRRSGSPSSARRRCRSAGCAAPGSGVRRWRLRGLGDERVGVEHGGQPAAEPGGQRGALEELAAAQVLVGRARARGARRARDRGGRSSRRDRCGPAGHRVQLCERGVRVACSLRRLWISGIDGRVALVTGARRASGAAIAAALAAEGARVAITSRSRGADRGGRRGDRRARASRTTARTSTRRPALLDDVEARAGRPGRHPRAQHRRAAGRARPARASRASSGRRPTATLVLAPMALSSARARDARARLGPDPQRRLDDGARADRRC